MPDIREEFEAYWKDRCAKQRPYSTVNLKTVAEEAWQASRAALLKDHVPMPRQCPSWLEDAYDEAWQDDKHFIDGLSLPAYEAMLKAQEEALQQAGIEVKQP